MSGSVARVTEISAISENSFEDAVQVGLQRAAQTLRHVTSAWVKDQKISLDGNGGITGYQVNLLVTFVLD